MAITPSVSAEQRETSRSSEHPALRSNGAVCLGPCRTLHELVLNMLRSIEVGEDQNVRLAGNGGVRSCGNTRNERGVGLKLAVNSELRPSA